MNKNILKNLGYVLITGLICISSTSKVYAWDGKKDGTGTHSVIVTQAVEMLEKDFSDKEPEVIKQNFKVLKNNLHKFQLGSTYPDYDPNAYKLYQDHFWDPDTNHNFSKDNKWYLAYAVPETAESQVRKFTAIAKNEWAKGDYEKATWYLGQAMHYFGDLNTPYHAANVTAADSPGHVKYETYVEQRKDNYKLYSTGYKTNETFYSDILINDDFDDWSKQYSTYWAKQAKSLYYTHSTMNHNWNDWEYSAIHAVGNAQKGTAGYIYRFLYDISKNLLPYKNHETNELMVVIKTANEQNAGTDNYISFGIETKDGKQHEWKLDNPGNDFEKNQEDTYILKFKDNKIKYNQISKMWIKKSKLVSIEDEWKPEYVKVIIDGNIQCEKNINEWIKGNTTHYIK